MVPLGELFGALLPGHLPAAGLVARISIHDDGLDVPVVVRGVDRGWLHVSFEREHHGALAPRRLVVLRIVTASDDCRIDLPVEVIGRHTRSLELRVLDAPLVLRRRVVRDQAVAEALGATGGG